MPSILEQLRRADRHATTILLFLLTTAMGNGAVATFMGYHFVQELGLSPWHISLYSVIVVALTTLANRAFGERIDRGRPIYPLIALANLAFLAGTVVIGNTRSYLVLAVVAGPFFALGNTAGSSLFALGRLYAAGAGVETARYNTLLRSMVSLAWMTGPACGFAIAGRWGDAALFPSLTGLAVVNLVLARLWLPRRFGKAPAGAAEKGAGGEADPFNLPLLLAGAACLLFSMAHSLCAIALPLFYTKEVGLPLFAPGLSLSIKCGMEIVMILSAARLAARFGARNCLLVAAALGIFAYAMLHRVDSIPSLCLGAFFEGLYYGLFAGVSVTFVQSFARGRIGRATSLYMNSLFLGGTLASCLVGLVAGRFDFASVILAAMGAMGLAALLLVATRRFDRLAEGDAGPVPAAR